MALRNWDIADLVDAAAHAHRDGIIWPDGDSRIVSLPYFRMGDGNACGVVLVANVWSAEAPYQGDYACYVGGLDPYLNYHDAAFYLARHGCKLTALEAAMFVELSGLPYRD